MPEVKVKQQKTMILIGVFIELCQQVPFNEIFPKILAILLLHTIKFCVLGTQPKIVNLTCNVCLNQSKPGLNEINEYPHFIT